MSSKRGTILDILPLGVILLGFALTIIISYTSFNAISQSGSLNTTTESRQIVQNTLEGFSVWDNIFLAAFLGLSITTIIAAAQVKSSPLFFFISLILYSIVLLVGYVIQTTYNAVSSDAVLSASVYLFPKLNYIMTHLLFFLIIIGTLISIALYSNRGGGDGAGAL